MAAHGVGVYSRISDDQEGEAKGVARQEADARALAEARGWTVADVYQDNDVSAYKRRVKRPAWERMLADLSAGRLGGVVAYDLDRLARQPRDLERLVTIYEDRPGLRFATATGDYDLSDPNGLFMARTMVNIANKASADTGRRVKRKHLELAQAGVPVGGGRPFGYKTDRRTLEPLEAEAIRTGAERLLAGAPLAAIVAEWNQAGLHTPRGNPWRLQTVKTLYRNPRFAGFRSTQVETQGQNGKGKAWEIVTAPDGTHVRGQWEPVLDVETWEAVVDRIGRAANGDRGTNARKYLLTPVLRCGKCGGSMRGVVAPVRKGVRVGGDSNFYYQCPSKAQGGCGGVTRSGPRTDELVVAALRARLQSHVAQAQPADPERWAGQPDLEAVERQLREAYEAWRADLLPAVSYFPLRAELEAEQQRLKRERTAWAAEHQSAGDVASDALGRWDTLPLAHRQALVSDNLQAVVVLPSLKRGSKVFDPSRFSFVWRD